MIPTFTRFCGIVFHDVLLEELVDQGQDGVGILGPGLGLADPFGDRTEHLAEPVAVGAGSHPQAIAQVVNQDDVPGAEELGRQEVGRGAVRAGSPPSRRSRSLTLPWKMKTQVVPA